MVVFHAAETIKGGVATVLNKLASGQSGCSYVDKVICLVPRDQVEEVDKENFYEVYTFTRPRSKRSFLGCVFFAIQFLKILFIYRPNIIHLHSSISGFIGRILSLLLKCFFRYKVVYCPHSFAFLMNISNLKRNLYIFVEKIFSHFTDKIICVSKKEYDEGLNVGISSKKMSLIYNGVEVRNKVNHVNNNNNINAVFIGRFDYQKGFDILIESISRVNRKDINFILVGGFVQGDKISNIPRLENLKVLEWIPHNELIDIYKGADILLFPSRWEGLSMTLLESISFGVSVIASDIDSVREVIEDNKSGFLFESGNVDELTRTINAVSIQKIERCRDYINNYSSKKFSDEKMVDDTINLYRSLILK